VTFVSIIINSRKLSFIITQNSDNWFVGGVTGMKAHQSTVKLDFLEKGKKYVATIYQDAKNANYKTNPQAYVITKKTVTSKSVLKLNSVAGGGFAISILAQ
jgi:glucan 1,4-alpha-glucosidase